MPNLIYSNGQSQAVSFTVTSDYTPIDFSSHTRFTAEFFGRQPSNNFTLDTDETAGVITGDSDGTISISLATAYAEMDSYIVRLIGYSADYPNGFVYFHPCCTPLLSIKVCGDPPVQVESTDGAYFEVAAESYGDINYLTAGVGTAKATSAAISGGPQTVSTNWAVKLHGGNIEVFEAGSSQGNFATAVSFLMTGTLTVGVAVKPPKMWISVNGTWIGDPVAETGEVISTIPTGTALYAVAGGNVAAGE